uniref:(northern house mosquito) hypothetical protein n=1 Tax=Culex pipiens TaxID=7175 RepID=A0A8D8CB30_CULPI
MSRSRVVVVVWGRDKNSCFINDHSIMMMMFVGCCPEYQLVFESTSRPPSLNRLLCVFVCVGISVVSWQVWHFVIIPMEIYFFECYGKKNTQSTVGKCELFVDALISV